MNGGKIITDWPWFPYTRVVLAGCKFNRFVPQHRNDGDRMSCMWKTAGWGSSELSYTDYIAGESIGEGANTTSGLALLLQLLACRNVLLRQVCWTPPRATIPLQE
jgi:hypothetical protein